MLSSSLWVTSWLLQLFSQTFDLQTCFDGVAMCCIHTMGTPATIQSIPPIHRNVVSGKQWFEELLWTAQAFLLGGGKHTQTSVNLVVDWIFHWRSVAVWSWRGQLTKWRNWKSAPRSYYIRTEVHWWGGAFRLPEHWNWRWRGMIKYDHIRNIRCSSNSVDRNGILAAKKSS